MPWIKESDCSGCGICVEKCPAEAIAMNPSGKAVIDMGKCVRCGVCHGVCPRRAVSHDSELSPSLAAANIADVSAKIDLCGERIGAPERERSLERFIKHYRREISVAENTIEGLEKLRRSGS